MLKNLSDLYMTYHAKNIDLYKERIENLKKGVTIELPRYVRNELPLYTGGIDNTIRYVTMDTIESDIKLACANGISFVEYKIHKHHYPGFRGDNVSFFTEKYYICLEKAKEYIEIPGAPSYIAALRQKLPGFIVTFRECEDNNGYLRIELP